MPRVCNVCQHIDRPAIEEEVNKGTSLAEVGRRFNLSGMSIHRHMAHAAARAAILAPPIPPRIAPNPAPVPTEPLPPVERYDAYERLVALAKKSEALLEKAEAEDNNQLQLWAMAEVRKNMETMLKVYEAQERLKALYAEKDDISASYIFNYLRGRYPEILEEMVDRMKEARQG